MFWPFSLRQALLIHLNKSPQNANRSQRFEHHRDLNTSSKIRLKVQFPLTINMLPYTNQSRSHDIRENRQLARSCTYDLLSVVVHDGSMNTGHYISYSRVGNEVSYEANPLSTSMLI